MEFWAPATAVIIAPTFAEEYSARLSSCLSSNLLLLGNPLYVSTRTVIKGPAVQFCMKHCTLVNQMVPLHYDNNDLRDDCGDMDELDMFDGWDNDEYLDDEAQDIGSHVIAVSETVQFICLVTSSGDEFCYQLNKVSGRSVT